MTDRDDTRRFRAIPPPAHSPLPDRDHAIGRLSGEVSRCALAIDGLKDRVAALKQADDDMHERMDAVVAYVERSKGRDRIIAAIAGILLTAIAGAGVLLVRNDEGLREARGDVVEVRSEAAETAQEIRAVRRDVAELNRSLAAWQATAVERLEQVDDRSRRNDDAIRALERGGTPALRRELRERGD